MENITENKGYRTVVPKDKPFYEAVKRIFDIAVSFIALILLIPLFIIVAIAIKIDSKGEVFYVSKRLTKDGKEFMMYKFRSMYKDADKRLASLMEHNEIKDGPAFKMTDDPRITPVGKFLRKTSIDELPQLLNVIKGEMSIVGPRPPLPSEVEHYNDYQKQRLGVTQGLTCYWQCNGRNDIGFIEWVELDLKYIEERGILTDLKIILKTFGAVLSMKGAK